jgi:hypothetical protein
MYSVDLDKYFIQRLVQSPLAFAWQVDVISSITSKVGFGAAHHEDVPLAHVRDLDG